MPKGDVKIFYRLCMVCFGAFSILLGWQGMREREAACGSASRSVNDYPGMLFVGVGLLALTRYDFLR